MRVYQEIILPSADVSMSQESDAFQLNQMFNACASCVVSGGGDDATGTLTILGSVDNTNFQALQLSGVDMTLTVAGNGTYIFDVTQTALQYLKVTYTAGSGTGNLEVTIFAKGF